MAYFVIFFSEANALDENRALSNEKSKVFGDASNVQDAFSFEI